MSTIEISNYYDSTENSATREDLIFALDEVKGSKTAIDCGCGAGSDIAYLRSKDFTVYAFDIEKESISRCSERFKDDDNVLLSTDSFSTFNYPDASLVVADASLFFCFEKDFESVWEKITNSLIKDGIFCGSFLGPKDTMAGPDYDKEAFWSDTLVMNEAKIREKLKSYEILKWSEHDLSGETSDGKPHHWHIFSLVARKI
ncbi:methyltransferase domain-containing protein [Colwellia sp. RSH04]|uniref:methyltransferase domain-containing protein n=1 Tax=Colwellia sp. RSH04 TaxID=2305464 RepID=UPI000E58DE5F|nr:methyltransferase domain-containing protein [Colwellia sp. RSH04]RHW74639.1 methyltransferase domain-containing protein [Colwellia sp. RSH04]